MRIVFLGTPEVAVPALDALLDAGHDLVLVVTRPDRPVGRSGRPVASPVKRRALDRGLEVCQPTKIRNAAFRGALEQSRPDVLVVVAYGRILPRSILDLPRAGAINVHFSLLPSYRGAAPVQWALARGERTTGVTTMRMNERLDEGDVLLQRELAIRPGEHAPALQARLAALGSALLVETLARSEAGTLEPRPQDHSRATLAPLLSVEDGEVDLRLPAREIEGRIRGFDPWPGVWVRRSGKRLRLVEARELGETRGEPPGRVLELRRDGLLLACGDGSVLLVSRVQPEGRKDMTVRDAVNGRQIATGDRLL